MWRGCFPAASEAAAERSWEMHAIGTFIYGMQCGSVSRRSTTNFINVSRAIRTGFPNREVQGGAIRNGSVRKKYLACHSEQGANACQTESPTGHSNLSIPEIASWKSLRSRKSWSIPVVFQVEMDLSRLYRNDTVNSQCLKMRQSDFLVYDFETIVKFGCRLFIHVFDFGMRENGYL